MAPAETSSRSAQLLRRRRPVHDIPSVGQRRLRRTHSSSKLTPRLRALPQIGTNCKDRACDISPTTECSTMSDDPNTTPLPPANQEGAAKHIPIFIQPDPSRPPIPLYQSSYALVIGITKYTNGWRTLNKAVEDAEAVAETLEKQGFEVRLERDLCGADLVQVFEEWFLTVGQQEDVRLLVWFAGHGQTIERSTGIVPNAYIVAADAPDPDAVPPSEKLQASILFKRRSLPLSQFGEYMREANARHILVVCNSCFSGSIFSASRAPSPAISMYTSKPARQFITSGKAGQTVSDNGMFRRLFVSAITGDDPEADANKDGFVTASELGLFLQQKVTNATGNVQTPDYGSLREEGFDRGDFVFAIPRFSATDSRQPTRREST